MGRPVILGNGSLTVGLNEQGLINDFYYPYVGLDNLNTSRSMHHRIGLWVDGVFSWVDEGDWDIEVNFETNALISHVSMSNKKLLLKLDFNDFVDWDFNAFCRHITITELSHKDRDVRLFMHQVFEISRRGRADTALFVPEENYILDYKGRCSLLIYGQSEQGSAFDQFAVGNYGIEGKEGTYKDAEDGELSANAVEHGGVDSVIRFSLRTKKDSSLIVDYWIIAADSQYTAEGINRDLRKGGLQQRIDLNRNHWKNWLNLANTQLIDTEARYSEAIKKSLMVIKAHTDKRGGIIASCDSSIYNYGRDYYSYVWPRDGAYAIWPLIKLGYQDEPRRFFEFCRDILSTGGYLMHKYQPDRAIGSTWHPLIHGKNKELAIQEDETAIVLFMIGEYLKYSNDRDFVFSLYNTFIQPAANFLAKFIDPETKLPHASYDLWEEKFLTHTYTAATVYQALLVGADIAASFEYPDDAVHWRDSAIILKEQNHIFYDPDRQLYRKGYLLAADSSITYDDTLDISSLFGVVFFGYDSLNSNAVKSTVSKIEELLLNKSPSGGVPRYEHDHYFEQHKEYLGNPWFVTSLWLAQYYLLIDRGEQAQQIIDWTLSHALKSGVLSEQIDPVSGTPLSVTPLVWSHAELINTLLQQMFPSLVN